MKFPFLLWACAALAASSVSPVSAEIEFYYSVNQEVYQVTEFENGLPKLDQKVERTAVPSPERLRHFQWQIKGELPLDARWARPMVEYSVVRVPPTYADRRSPPVAEVRLGLKAVSESADWEDADKVDYLVVGWVVEGTVKEAFVTRFDAEPRYTDGARMILPESERHGFPLCWVVKDGAAVERKRSAAWDPFFFGQGDDADLEEVANARDEAGNTALHYAAANDLDRLAEALLANDPKLVKTFNESERSPLAMAVSCSRSALAERLVAAKAPLLDGPADSRWIVLEAVRSGYLDVLKAVATEKPRSSDLKAQYSFALSEALNFNFEEQALHLLDLGAKFTIEKADEPKLALEKFANGYPDLGFRMMELLKVKPTSSDNGFNLLHAAAGYADVALLERLREMGCDVKERTADGVLPMDVAVALGNVDAICWFIENGGRNPAEEGFVNPVLHAIKAGQQESVECLINYGFDVNREVTGGVTPLMFAVYKGELDIARAIQKAGGVWMIDHAFMDLLIARLASADASDLLASVIEQGWSVDRRVGQDFALHDVADFYEASSILERLEEMGFSATGAEIRPLKDVDRKPKLVTPFQIQYPLHLQRRFGDREVLVEVCLNRAGQPSLLSFGEGLEPELLELVENALFQLRFEPALVGDQAVPVSLKIKAPLQTDTEKIFELADVDEKPRYRRFAKPVYPFALQQNRTKGQVLVEFVLLASSEVTQVRVMSATHAAFAEPAMDAVMQSEWIPARKNGEPVACRVHMPIVFTP